MPAHLAEIIDAHRRGADADARDLDALRALAGEAPRPASFLDALRDAGRRTGDDEGPGLAVIAEVKRRSPSKGPLAVDLDPAQVASEYAAGGAACLSVLTDTEFFGGSPDDLVAARLAAGLPALRKDFTVSAADVCDARIMGASAVLLIVAALDDAELAAMHALALELALEPLVEVHDEDELDRALALGPRLVGVNRRDLSTFEVDHGLAARLAPRIPPGVVAVAESGVHGPDDARRLASAGYDAVLVGEAAVTSGDRAAAVRALAGHRVAVREAAPLGRSAR